MKKHRIINVILLAVFFVVCMSPVDLWAQDISKELKIEHKVVRILDREGIVPNTLIVNRGTTVIWVSYFSSPIEIKFTKSKVTTACRQPINFITTKDGTYQSNTLTAGATASLCFIEKGDYEYQFKPRVADWTHMDPRVLKGVIRVH